MNEFLSEHVNPESVTSFVDNSARNMVIQQFEEAADEAEKEDCAQQDKLSDVLTRLARLRIFAGIVANLNRGGIAKLRTEEEVNAAPFFTEDLAAVEDYVKECEEASQSCCSPDGACVSKSRQKRLAAQIPWHVSSVTNVKVTSRRPHLDEANVAAAQKAHDLFVEQHKELK